MNSELLEPVAFGKRIRLLRRSRHWTQAELASKVGIRTGPMNYLENGHHLPSLPVLVRLAEIFDISMDQLLSREASGYVVRESPAPYGGQVCQSEDVKWATPDDYLVNRALLVRFDPVKEPLDAAAVARLEQAVDAILALEDLVEVPKQAQIPLQIRLPLRESGFDRYVRQVRGLLGVNDAVIFDYLELFENAGLRVVFLPLPQGAESVACFDRANANAFFFVNSVGLSVERKLFRLCYELGRIYLFNGGMRFAARIGTLDAEHAARRFAALFLMPEEAVLGSVRQVGVAPDAWTWELLMRLKHRFGVSSEAFLYRLEELELITPPVRDELKRAIYAYYTAKGNAEPDSSRRVLTPNGRLGDLLLSAAIRAPDHPELASIQGVLQKLRIKMP